jgi:hypothetical protein
MEEEMKMGQVKLVLLKQRPEYLIGKVTELDEEPSLLIESCYEIVDGDLVAFPRFSAQRDMFLTSDTIMSILDPSPEVLEKYNQE